MRRITIKVTHLGQDYGKVEVHESTALGGMIYEYEVALGLAEALAEYLKGEKK